MPVRAISGPLNKNVTGRIPATARARSYVTPAPVGGWNARDPLSDMEESDAIVFDNWFPEETSIRTRYGSASYVTNLPNVVDTLMVWSGPSTQQMFAASNGAIYDVSSPGVVGASSVALLASDRWQSTMFGNAAGNFLYAVNGQDDPLYYDGSTWQNPSLSGVDPTTLVYVNVFKQRLFFLEKESLAFWYLDVESIQGNLTRFDLGPFASLGGYLVAMGTWTNDSRTSGIDDYAVFITSNGEVLIFQGTDPSSAASWGLYGTYRIGSPLGRRCFVKIGGELIVITRDGFSSMSKFLSAARASQKAALSDKIVKAVRDATATFTQGQFGWQPIFYPQGGLILINNPNLAQATQFVSNSTTGAWCRYTGLPDAHCWVVFKDQLFFGGHGTVYQAETGFDDDGTPITATVKPAFSYFGNRAEIERFTMCRPNLIIDGDASATIAQFSDFEEVAAGYPIQFSPNRGGVWDQATWDVDEWAGSIINSNWVRISGVGRSGTIQLVTTSQDGGIRWNNLDWLFEPARGVI